MNIWKLVSGILSIILSAFVLFQSSLAGLGNALAENNEVSGTAGLFVAICLLAGGIVSIATKKSTKKGGNIALVILYGIGAVVGMTMAGSYGDLRIWGGWCLICTILTVISLIKNKKNNTNL